MRYRVQYASSMDPLDTWYTSECHRGEITASDDLNEAYRLLNKDTLKYPSLKYRVIEVV